MNKPRRQRVVEHRGFWQKICMITFGLTYLIMGGIAQAGPDADCQQPPTNPDCGTHNMMVVGKQAAFLSHLPMFHSEHRFQVILQGTFSKDGTSRDGVYAKDRESHPKTKMYTVKPADQFVLSRLFSSGTEPPLRNAFPGTVFRGHLERDGAPIDGLTGVDVHITRVVYAHELRPHDRRADKLAYILFGQAGDLFLAHLITHEPDFDQIVAVQVDGHDFTEAELHQGVIVTIPNRENAAVKRLRTKETAAAEARVSDAQPSLPLQIHVDTEFYFEEGELLVPAKFEQTSLEEEVGF